MARLGFFLALLWGGVLLLFFWPSSPAPWLQAALREGRLPSSNWDLSTITDLVLPLPLLGEKQVAVRASRAVPLEQTLGPLRLGGIPQKFRLEVIRVGVLGLLFEAERGDWDGHRLQLRGKVRVSRDGRLLMEAPSISLASEKDWIQSNDLVLLLKGPEGSKKAHLGIALESRTLK